MRRRARIAVAISVLAASSSSSSASGQPSSSETALAIQLFEDAEKLMTSGNAAAACPKYAESQRLDPQLGTLLHLADCHEKVGKLASAWAGYKEAAELAARRNAAGGNEHRERVARARAAALEPRLSTVVIHIAQTDLAGLEIRRDGEPLGRALWGSIMPVDPGSYTFTAQAPGKKLWTKTIDVRPDGAKIDLTVPALEDARGTASVAKAADAPSDADRPGRGTTQKTAGYILAGVGAVGVGLGAVFGLTYLSQRNELDGLCRPADKCTSQTEVDKGNDLQESIPRNGTISVVSFAIGGAAAAAGVALLLTAPSSRSPTATMVNLVPWGGPNAAGASIAGRW